MLYVASIPRYDTSDSAGAANTGLEVRDAVDLF